MDDEFVVVENIQRDPKTGKTVAASFWVCGPQGFLKGPYSEREAQGLARRLSEEASAAEGLAAQRQMPGAVGTGGID